MNVTWRDFDQSRSRILRWGITISWFGHSVFHWRIQKLWKGEHGERGSASLWQGLAGRAPSGVQGQSPWSGVRGRRLLKLKAFWQLCAEVPLNIWCFWNIFIMFTCCFKMECGCIGHCMWLKEVHGRLPPCIPQWCIEKNIDLFVAIIRLNSYSR